MSVFTNNTPHNRLTFTNTKNAKMMYIVYMSGRIQAQIQINTFICADCWTQQCFDESFWTVLLSLRSFPGTMPCHSGNDTLYIASSVFFGSTDLTHYLHLPWLNSGYTVFFFSWNSWPIAALTVCFSFCFFILEHSSVKPNKQAHLENKKYTMCSVLIAQHQSHNHHEDGNTVRYNRKWIWWAWL